MPRIRSVLNMASGDCISKSTRFLPSLKYLWKIAYRGGSRRCPLPLTLFGYSELFIESMELSLQIQIVQVLRRASTDRYLRSAAGPNVLNRRGRIVSDTISRNSASSASAHFIGPGADLFDGRTSELRSSGLPNNNIGSVIRTVPSSSSSGRSSWRSHPRSRS